MADPDEQAFFDFMETERSASPRTLRNYRSAMETYVEWRGEAFEGWRNAGIDDYRDYLFDLMKQGLKRSTIRLRFAALRSFYKFLVLRRGLANSPVAGVQLPKPDKQLPVVLSVAQIEQLLGMPLTIEPDPKSPAWLRLRDTAILELFYSCGLRISELLAIDVSDVDFIGETLQAPRSASCPLVGPRSAPSNATVRKPPSLQGRCF